MLEASKNVEHSKSSRPSAAWPAPCFTSKNGKLQSSDQDASQHVSFARTHLATHDCIRASSRRSSCLSLSDFDAHLVFYGQPYLFFFSHTFLKHLPGTTSCCSTSCPWHLSACPTPCFTSQVGTIQRSKISLSLKASIFCQETSRNTG